MKIGRCHTGSTITIITSKKGVGDTLYCVNGIKGFERHNYLRKRYKKALGDSLYCVNGIKGYERHNYLRKRYKRPSTPPHNGVPIAVISLITTFQAIPRLQGSIFSSIRPMVCAVDLALFACVKLQRSILH